MRAVLFALPLLALAACSQSDAPSEKMGAAAEELVESVVQSPVAAEGTELGRYAPRNECTSKPGSQAFLSALRAAVELRDADLLVALAATDIKLDFGGGDGEEELRRRLDAEGHNLWGELEEVLTLGCASNSQGGITLPWYFAQNFTSDPFQTMIAMGDNVLVHQTPADDSPRVASLNWEAVEVIYDDDGVEGWTHIRLPEGRGDEASDGYVLTERLRSQIDYRLIAASRNGRWRITTFVAGD